MKKLGVGKEQWRIPAEQDEARNQVCVRISGNVVIALHLIDAAEHGRMRTPPVPQELDDGNDNRQCDARNGAEYRHAGEAGDGKPELPALNAIDAAQVGHFDQADG